MTPPVTRKLCELTASAAPGGEDVWRDFRRVEVLDLELAFKFRHSLGKVSAFFLELEQAPVATRCPAAPPSGCRRGRVRQRPRGHGWIRLSGAGAWRRGCRYTGRGGRRAA